MKKRNWYLLVFFIGIILILTGVLTLWEAVSKKDASRIWIQSLMMAFWIAFTISNYFLFRKETKKVKENTSEKKI